VVAEYLARANWQLLIGNFEVNFANGQVRYRTSVDVKGGTLTPTMITNMIRINIAMMERYLPGLNKVAFGNASPAAAIAEIGKRGRRSRPPAP